jgi:formylglycine-generating enzyme required for sulfatase activity
MTDIFISYSRKDLEMAKTLARTLEELGYVVWWDMSGLHGGQAFAQVIQEKLNEAKCAIVIWSEHSVKSKWVQSEASFADSRDILLTTMYQDVKAPMPFNTRHNEDLRGWDGDVSDEGFQKLIIAVERSCSAPLVAPDHSVVGFDLTSESDTLNPIIKNSSKARIGLKGVSIIAAMIVISIAVLSYSNGFFENQAQVALGEKPIGLSGFASQKTLTVSKMSKFQIKKLSKPAQAALEDARDALADDRLTGPKIINVVSYVEKILRESPAHLESLGLIKEAATRLQIWVELGIEKKTFNNAQNYLEASKSLIDKYSLGSIESNQNKLSLALMVAKRSPVEIGINKTGQSKVHVLGNNLTLLPIPAGSFKMGLNSTLPGEKLAHIVSFTESFWMSKTEITFEQYDVYVESENADRPKDMGWGRGDQPVINVSWNDAQGFTEWLTASNSEGLRCSLPSEAEWEYAARAGTTTNYFWGDKVGENNANCIDCGSPWDEKVAAPVGSFPANQWGLHDMHGNVREWVQDRWHENYINAPENGEVWIRNGYPNLRIHRGGSSFDNSYRSTSSNRTFEVPHFRIASLGFRVACSTAH